MTLAPPPSLVPPGSLPPPASLPPPSLPLPGTATPQPALLPPLPPAQSSSRERAGALGSSGGIPRLGRSASSGALTPEKATPAVEPPAGQPSTTKVCSSCQRMNPRDARFCNGCGAKWISCAACGRDNPPDARFCNGCGAPAAPSTASVPTAPSTTSVPIAPRDSGRAAGLSRDTSGGWRFASVRVCPADPVLIRCSPRVS
jgi:hypothetical protein